jgi:GNAT superfamily N-acetyltransferase
MNIVEANKKEKDQAIKIAKTLKDWFNDDGIKNLKIDFDHNTVVVAKENKEVVGFMCYTTYCGKTLLIWLGAKRNTKGVGQELLEWLVNKSKELGMYTIELETLPEEIEYEPYVKTREFYYKNGFERIFYRKATIEGWDDQVVLEKKI